jgi:hypothetical protein
MIFAFSVGLPLLYFGMLWTNRKQLFATDGSNQLAFLRFFYREYDEKLYYWVSELRATGRLYFDTNRLLTLNRRPSNASASPCSWALRHFFRWVGEEETQPGKMLGGWWGDML